MERLPQHIAIIMDGNGRWANARGLPRTAGHRAGMGTLHEIVDASGEIGLKILTVYAFSTENWKRPPEEVDFLMHLMVEYIVKELAELHEKGVQIRLMGDIEDLPGDTRNEMKNAIEVTRNNQGLVLNIAVNYGGRSEILRAVKQVCAEVRGSRLAPEEIDEELFGRLLYTEGCADPDLVIRPSGEMRLSNFMLWQIAYSEFWFDRILWPDFHREHLYQAIVEFQQRHRRYGGL
ncbi:MAG: isoprenyl transferase [Firmicutes bacterium]|nr:isoprenyl transferase [Bacillota bacterium]